MNMWEKSAQGNDVHHFQCILISLLEHCHYKVGSVPHLTLE